MRRHTARTRRARFGPAVVALFLASLLGGTQPGETYVADPVTDVDAEMNAGMDAGLEVSASEDGISGLDVARGTKPWWAVLPARDHGGEFLQGILTAVRPVSTWEKAGHTGRKEDDPEAVFLTGGPHLFTYEVRTGDTLWTLAQRYGTDVDTLLRINNLQNPRRLKLGQKIRILTVPGLIHTVRRGENVESIARLYKISPAAVILANDLDDPDHVRIGQILILPGAVPPPPPKPSTAKRVDRRSSGSQAKPVSRNTREGVAARGGIPSFIWPVEGPISSYYGPRWGTVHEGIDIAVPTGTAVRAAAGGTVIYAGAYGSYGILVIIDHGNGITTRYGHNSRVEVAHGEVVERGDVVARSGNTGRSTGPHLHFEVRKQGRPLNPLGYLP